MRLAALGVLASAVIAHEAAGQEYGPWLFRGDVVLEIIDSPLPQWTDWHDRTLAARRTFARGALGVELTSTERFGLGDEQLTLDAYRELWSGAYANLRVRGTRAADVLPGRDARAEVFQSVDGGWELSASYWYLDVPVADVGVAAVGAAKYVRSWYLRGQALLTRSAGESVLSAAFVARRFLTGPDDLVEAAGSVGQEVVVLGAGPVVDLRSTKTLQARGQRFLTDRVGISGRVGYTTFEGAPGRLALGVGALLRR